MQKMNQLPPLETVTLGLAVKHGIIAVLGAVAHAINVHRNGESKGFMDFFLLTVMSSFSGAVFALVSLHYFNSEYLSLAAAGSGGFLGVEGLTLLAGKIRDTLASFITPTPPTP